MTLLPIQNWSPSDPNVLGPFIDMIVALVTDYWWVAAIVILAWYLRWYGYAKREGIKPPAAAGAFGMAREALMAGKRGLLTLGLVLVTIFTLLGWVFDISTMLVVGLPALDPATWAVTVAGFLTAGNAFEWAVSANPGNILLAFIVTFGGLFALRRLGDMSRERNEDRREELEDDEDAGPMDFLYAYRPGSDD